jgi:hypothetical protein
MIRYAVNIMDYLLYCSAILLVGLGLAHSYLGEKYILMRLFRRDNLPKIFGGDEFTKNTLRFAWHLTSVAWLGLAALIVYMAQPTYAKTNLGNIIGATLLAHFLVALIGSKAKHFSWVIFLIVGLLVIAAANA